MNCQIAGAGVAVGGWSWESSWICSQLVRSMSSLGTPKLVTGISSEHSFVGDCALKSVDSNT